jgi:hypothetical protein
MLPYWTPGETREAAARSFSMTLLGCGAAGVVVSRNWSPTAAAVVSGRGTLHSSVDVPSDNKTAITLIYVTIYIYRYMGRLRCCVLRVMASDVSIILFS